jgi:hypothetical protein
VQEQKKVLEGGDSMAASVGRATTAQLHPNPFTSFLLAPKPVAGVKRGPHGDSEDEPPLKRLTTTTLTIASMAGGADPDDSDDEDDDDDEDDGVDAIMSVRSSLGVKRALGWKTGLVVPKSQSLTQYTHNLPLRPEDMEGKENMGQYGAKVKVRSGRRRTGTRFSTTEQCNGEAAVPVSRHGN